MWLDRLLGRNLDGDATRCPNCRAFFPAEQGTPALIEGSLCCSTECAEAWTLWRAI